MTTMSTMIWLQQQRDYRRAKQKYDAGARVSTEFDLR
jgi:hypothetical protein